MNNIPYDLSPDDDTEEMNPREIYKPPAKDSCEFPDFDLFPEPFPEIKKGTQHS